MIQMICWNLIPGYTANPTEEEEEKAEGQERTINISDLPPSDGCITAQSKGLSFSPTYSGRHFDTKVDLFQLYRSLHLKVLYHQNT